MVDYRWPEPKTEPDEPRCVIVDTCCMCGYDIRTGEEYFDFHGDIVCEECKTPYLNQYRKVVYLHEII